MENNPGMAQIASNTDTAKHALIIIHSLPIIRYNLYKVSPAIQ